MLKLYLREAGRVTAYHEAWADGLRIIEHWGPLGKRGKTQQRRRDKKVSEDRDLKKVLKAPLAAGYKAIDLDDHAVLLIEYPIKGMGSVKDVDKRHALEVRMNETLGWTGLGHCDGGSIGSGAMDVCCYVVDFDAAKRVIEKDLKRTKFADYSRIYDERAAEPDAAGDREPEPDAQGSEMYAPPWVMFPGLKWKDKRWKSGKPAEYLTRWAAWFQSTPADARKFYSSLFGEPEGWSGFYKSAAKRRRL